jgi:hypothetical protein
MLSSQDGRCLQQPAESAANLDGKLDIAEVNTGDSRLGVLGNGNGDGTSQKMLPFMTDKGTRSVAIGDLKWRWLA